MNKIKMAKAGLELAERLYQQLWNEFGGVYIGKSVYNIGKGCRRDGKIYKEEGLFPVGFPMYPQLYDMMERIMEALGIEGKVDLFIENTDKIYASSRIWYDNGECRDIVLSSSLVHRFSDEEICYVIGHEMGHFIMNDTKLRALLAFVFIEEKIPWTLDRRLRLGGQLTELFCDRCGCMAARRLEPCVNAMFQMEYGMEISRFGNSVNKYISQSERKLKEMCELPGYYNLEYHPDAAVRVLSMKLFAEANDEESLRKETLALIEPLLANAVTKVNDSELRMMVAMAKMIEKKAGLTPGTYRAAMAECMKQYTLEADRCYDSIKDEELEQKYEELVNKVKSFECSTRNVLPGILEMAFWNRVPSSAEIDFVHNMAVVESNVSEEEFEHFISRAIKSQYKPDRYSPLR